MNSFLDLSGYNLSRHLTQEVKFVSAETLTLKMVKSKIKDKTICSSVALKSNSIFFFSCMSHPDMGVGSSKNDIFLKVSHAYNRHAIYFSQIFSLY